MQIYISKKNIVKVLQQIKIASAKNAVKMLYAANKNN
jgi:hypothetical protein